MTELFEPLTVRGTTIPNRVWMSPDVHLLGTSRKARILVPRTISIWPTTPLVPPVALGWPWLKPPASCPRAGSRLTTWDCGATPRSPPTAGLATGHRRTPVQLPGIQLAHAGRKASMERPWLGGGPVA